MCAKPWVEVEDIDHGWKKLMKEIKKLDKSYTAVGWFGHGGDPSNDVAARAAILNTGATIRVTKKMRGYLSAVLGIHLKKSTHVIRLPARPFVKKTASLFKRKLADRMKIEYNNMLGGKQNAKKTLARIGEWYVGKTKYVMTHVSFTANSSATVRKKGSSRPLIDSGETRSSTTHREVMH